MDGVSVNVLIQQKCGRLLANPLIKVGDMVFCDATIAPVCFASVIRAFGEAICNSSVKKPLDGG